MRNWLVIGGAGYIGAHVTRHMRKAGYEVQVVDNLSTGLGSRLPAGVSLHECDVRDTAEFRKIVHELKPHGMVYLAGLKQARESMVKPAEYWGVNVGGLLSTVDAIRESSVKHFVFSSSCSIFGDATGVTETSSVNPQSVYATTKHVSEVMLKDCMMEFGISYAVLRYFNVIGNGNFPDSADRASQSLVPRITSLMQNNLPVEIYGSSLPTPDGTCLRDYVDVRDIAKAHTAVASVLTASDQSLDSLEFNLGSDMPTSVLTVVQELSKAMRSKAEISFKPPNSADPVSVWSDSTKARDALKWTPEYSMEQSLIAHCLQLLHSKGPQ